MRHALLLGALLLLAPAAMAAPAVLPETPALSPFLEASQTHPASCADLEAIPEVGEEAVRKCDSVCAKFASVYNDVQPITGVGPASAPCLPTCADLESLPEVGKEVDRRCGGVCPKLGSVYNDVRAMSGVGPASLPCLS